MTEPIRIELPTVFDIMTVNAWLFLEPEPVLIDCGEKSDKTWNSLQNQLKKYGLAVKDLSRVIITHAHSDHIGMANKIAANSDATIWVNEHCYDWAVNLEEMLERRRGIIVDVAQSNLPPSMVNNQFNFGYKELKPYWDEIPEKRLHLYNMDDILQFGGQNWQTIYTPGHCINQVCFFQKDTGYLLSADMLLQMIPTPIIDASLEAPYHPVRTLVMMMKSYQKLIDLDITKVFPGHYETFENATQVINQQRDKIIRRKEECLQYIQQGVEYFETLWQNIYGRRMNYGTFFMMVGYLGLLLEEEKIKTVEKDGRMIYQLL